LQRNNFREAPEHAFNGFCFEVTQLFFSFG